MRYFEKQSGWTNVVGDIMKSTVNKNALVMPKAMQGAAVGAVGGGVIGGASSGDFGGAMRGAIGGAALGAGGGAYVGKRLGNFYGNIGRTAIAGGVGFGAFKAFKNPSVNNFMKILPGKARGFMNVYNKKGAQGAMDYAKEFFNAQINKHFPKAGA